MRTGIVTLRKVSVPASIHWLPRAHTGPLARKPSKKRLGNAVTVHVALLGAYTNVSLTKPFAPLEVRTALPSATLVWPARVYVSVVEPPPVPPSQFHVPNSRLTSAVATSDELPGTAVCARPVVPSESASNKASTNRIAY
jgi:hypothetical protein